MRNHPKAGDHVKMFWKDADANDPSAGDWWTGTVVHTALGAGSSPWEAIRVRWEGDEECKSL